MLNEQNKKQAGGGGWGALDKRKLETNFVAYRKFKLAHVWVDREIEYTTVFREVIRKRKKKQSKYE